MMNGIALHGGLIPYGGTFLTFSDYARNAVRMACLMQPAGDLRVHARLDRPRRGRPDAPADRAPEQPARSCRTSTCGGPAMPSRPPSPGRSRSSAHGPTALVLTRQALPQHRRAARSSSPTSAAAATCSSSRTAAARGAADRHRLGGGDRGRRRCGTLNGAGRRVRLVSMPSTETFDAQDAGLPRARAAQAVTRRVAVEAGARQSWWRYVGSDGRVVGIDTFGASGKAADVFPHFGFTAANIVDRNFANLLEGYERHGNQGRYQRLRAHRPQRAAGPVRGQAHRRDPDRRDQRSGRRRRPMLT